MSPSPLRMRWLARAMVCRPEEQKRFTVMPGTELGRRRRTAICRAMFQPVAPSGLAQPMITSSTSSASTLARSSAACTTCPPIFAPCVMLRAPRQLLQSGVRAVDTITASMGFLLRVEPLAFLGQLDEQRRGLPLRALVALLEALDGGEHLVEADAVGMEHRAAAVRQKAVAGEVHHVDVGGAQRDALLEDVRAFVGERVHAPRDDLLVGNLARLDADLLPVVLQERLHFWVGTRFLL